VTKKKIINSLDKLSKGELKALWQHILFQYVPDIGEKEDEILRDDIKDKVVELLLIEFCWKDEKIIELTSFLDKDTSLDEGVEFSEVVSKEFELDYISPDSVARWETVKDIVDYIEDNIGESDDN